MEWQSDSERCVGKETFVVRFLNGHRSTLPFNRWLGCVRVRAQVVSDKVGTLCFGSCEPTFWTNRHLMFLRNVRTDIPDCTGYIHTSQQTVLEACCNACSVTDCTFL
jgi:hypothetical protein